MTLFVLPVVTILLFSLAAFVGYFFLSGFIWGAGYYPTSRNRIEIVARFLDLHEGSKFYDLGSGYGRMIVAMGEKYGATSIGVEIDPIKCWWTNRVIRRKKLTRLVRVVKSNFLNADISDADSIFVFLSSETSIMEKVREKIFKECKHGTKVVSFDHRFSDWTPIKTEEKLFLYVTP